MDINLTYLAGSLSGPPELREFESDARLLRLLVTIRSDTRPRRVDVVPVTYWDPPAELLAGNPQRGDRVEVTGGVQRRFWSDDNGRRSRIEIVAQHVVLHAEEADEGEP